MSVFFWGGYGLFDEMIRKIIIYIEITIIQVIISEFDKRDAIFCKTKTL